jgi:tripartite motif-containing protein 71
MRRFALLVLVAFSVLAVSAGTAARDKIGSPPAQVAKKCKRGYKQGVIGGVRKCLKAGQPCKRSLDPQYHRYGFHCHSGRLTRKGGSVPPPPPPPPTPTQIFSGNLGPRGVTLDAQGNVYVADEGANEVVKLSPSGSVLGRFGRSFLNTPVKLRLDAQGNIWVTEHLANRVAKLSPSGERLAVFGTTGSAPGQFDHPNGIALDALGNVFVADHHNNRIQKLSPSGQPLAQWGTRGTGPGQFLGPIDVGLDGQGNIYVTDADNGRLQKLSPAGEPLAQFASVDPRGLAIDSQGNLYVGDNGRGQVVKLSPTGVLLAQWGTPGGDAGQIKLPAGVALDREGNVYVAEGDPEDGTACNCRVQKFSPTGPVLAVWR